MVFSKKNFVANPNEIAVSFFVFLRISLKRTRSVSPDLVIKTCVHLLVSLSHQAKLLRLFEQATSKK
jgi:hypothetical protein